MKGLDGLETHPGNRVLVNYKIYIIYATYLLIQAIRCLQSDESADRSTNDLQLSTWRVKAKATDRDSVTVLGWVESNSFGHEAVNHRDLVCAIFSSLFAQSYSTVLQTSGSINRRRNQTQRHDHWTEKIKVRDNNTKNMCTPRPKRLNMRCFMASWTSRV